MASEDKKYDENVNPPNRSMSKSIWRTMISFGLGFALAYLIYANKGKEKPLVLETHSVIRDKIESLGKMELVKYQFQNLVSHEVVREWFPDPEVRLFAYGEAVGCIDFRDIKDDDIFVQEDTVFIQLPEPEICYAKVDHEKSKVLYTRFTLFEMAEIVDDAYKAAEEEILTSARESHILEETKLQAKEMLPSYLTPFSGKQLIVHFADPVPVVNKD